MADDSTPRFHYIVYLPVKRDSSCHSFCISEKAEVGELEAQIRLYPAYQDAIKDTELRLYKCGALSSESQELFDQVSEWLREHSDELVARMEPTNDLKKYFPSGPASNDRETIDIVAVTDPILEALRQNEAETSEPVSRYLNRLDALIKDYLSGPSWSAFWKAASSADPQTAQFIDSLEIPLIKGSPDLLLHGLGSNMVDQSMIDNIFNGGNRFLVNAPGSGKTRLLFEGLCRHWGFYFVACLPSDQTLGSADLVQAAGQPAPNSTRFRKSEKSEGSRQDYGYDSNYFIAERLVYQITMARILVFERFLKAAQNLRSSSGSIDEFKKHWLYFQLFPKEILSADVFERLSFEILKDASDTYLLAGPSEINEKLTGLQKRFGLEGSFFFVLDEARMPARELQGIFMSRSAKDEVVERPGLLPIISTWVASHLPTIVSGTNLSIDVVNEALGPSVGRDFEFTLTTKTGTFDDPERQREYISRYIPRHLAESESGKELFIRAWKFLRGRHQLTASLLSQLLKFSFQSPHRVLNAYVKAVCGFLPSDSVYYIDNERMIDQELSLVRPFDFKFQNNFSFVTLLSYILYTLLIGRKPLLTTSDNKELVEQGFARFVDSSGGEKCTFDEPLVLLAVLHETDTWSRLSFGGHIKTALFERAGRCKNFEIFIAYYLACAFDNRRKLCDILEFGKDVPKWAKQPAQLVSLAWEDGKAAVSPFYLLDFLGFATTIVTKCKNIAETVRWFADPPSLMCFPDDYMGPDLIVFVRLNSGQILTVMIECKWWSASTLAPSVQKHALTSLDHSRFYEHNIVRKDVAKAARESILGTLRRLNGPNLDMQADGWFEDGVPVVKAIASYPAVAQGNLPPYHTTVNMDKCVESVDKNGALEVVKELVGIKKRAVEDGANGPRSKRLRSG